MKTTYRQCACGTRLLIVRGVPALNYHTDPAGKVAVSIDDPKRGRFLAKDEQPGPLEHRHTVHECEHTKRRQHRRGRTLHQPGTRPRRTPAQGTLL